ncbi:ParB/Srx family N-terminal domain-containing protein [uncultured Bilophila sp.]|jgi:ParB-like chromosome segregation protein Spo0J|uniref:ParB/Srx family N-terminal domain-containing protein n=1 Tax=uncultured Bilophila sp. TaxID=529385 RepID=UPI0025DE19AD|nr:ParB/Srx family N-terminal domain-containing protein [uncultured Bilophila sp.]
MDLKVEQWPIDRLIPYARNPRKNDAQVDRMCAAILEFGFRIPIVARSDGSIVDGHLRLKAARKLGLKDVPVALADELSDVQVKAFRLLANQSANWAEWDNELLALELEELKASDFDIDLIGFKAEVIESQESVLAEDRYTAKATTPTYEPTGKDVQVGELYDQTKADALVKAIHASTVSTEEKAFLLAAAHRHTVFNYENIAEYYANASPEMQRLMEQSALVIIDIDNAIENGFVELSSRIDELRNALISEGDNDEA